MADVTIDAACSASSARPRRVVVWTSTTTGYVFFIDADNDFKYTKSTDSGATWGTPVVVRTGTVENFDIWYDRWTPGDTGAVVHTAYVDSGIDDVLYRSLSTSDDTLGTEITVFAGASATTEARVSIAKSRGGNLLCAFNIDSGTEFGTYRSTDLGANWAARGEVIESGAADEFLVFPGNESDNQDMWIVFWDLSADEVSLKTYDDSANSVSETSISTSVVEPSTGAQPGIGGSIRHSDNHLILCAWNAYDVSTADLKCWDINGSGSITAKTDVVTNSDDCYNVGVFVNQNNADLYVGYVGKSDGTETYTSSVHLYYKKSTDGGASWGTETLFSESLSDKRRCLTDLGGTTSRFGPVWYITTSGPALLTNAVNSVAITPPAGATNVIWSSMVT